MLAIKIIVGIFLGIFVLIANVVGFSVGWSIGEDGFLFEPTPCYWLFMIVGFPGAIIALIIKRIISGSNWL
jgi:hypothetical protein